jgi:hypothetical protein
MNCEIREDGYLQKRKGKSVYGGATTGDSKIISGLFRPYTSASTSAQNERVTDNKATQKAKALVRLSDGSELDYGSDSDGTFTAISFVDQVQGAGASISTPFSTRFVQWANNRLYFTRANKSGDVWTASYMGRWGLNTAATSARYLYAARTDNPQGANALDGKDGDAVVEGDTTEGAIDVAVCAVIGPGTGYGGTWAESVVCARETWTQADASKKYKVDGIVDIDAATGDLSYDRHDVSEWNVYATDGGDSGGTMYYVGNVIATDGAEQSHQWVDADYDYSKTAPSASTTGTIADNPILIHAHNSRLWAVPQTNVDRIWFSNLNKPDEYPSTNYFSVHDEVTGIVSFRGDMIIFTPTNIYTMRGWSPEDFEATLEVSVAGTGCRAPDSVKVVNTHMGPMVFFVNEDGIKGFDGFRVHDVGRSLGGTFDNITIGNIESMRGIVHGDRYLLAYQDDRDSGSYNNRVLVFDQLRGNWFPWDGLDINAWCVWNGPSDSGELYAGDATSTGMTWLMEQTAEMADFRYKTKYFAPEGPEQAIQLGRLRMECQVDSLPLSVTAYLDGGRQEQTIDFPEIVAGLAHPSGTIRDGGYWQRTGTDTVAVVMPFQDSMIGKRFALKVHRHDTENKKIIGLSVNYEPKRGREGVQ